LWWEFWEWRQQKYQLTDWQVEVEGGTESMSGGDDEANKEANKEEEDDEEEEEDEGKDEGKDKGKEDEEKGDGKEDEDGKAMVVG
jgi:hypothetical protein